MRLIHLLALCCLLAFIHASPADAAISNDGLKNFHEAGFPAMSTLAGVLFIGLGIYYGMQHGGQSWKGDGSELGRAFLVLNTLNAFMGIILLFGPGTPAPRCNWIGFMLVCASAVGYYSAYSNLRSASKALFVLLTFISLAMSGSLTFVSFDRPLWLVNQASCLQYFGTTDPDFNRCLDEGYLQLIRTFSMFSLVFTLIELMQVFLALSDRSAVLGSGSNSQHAYLDKNQSFAGGARAPLMAGFGSDSFTPVLPSNGGNAGGAGVGVPAASAAAQSQAAGQSSQAGQTSSSYQTIM